MQVEFKKAQKLAGKVYAAGKQIVPDRLAYSSDFKKLVKAGLVVMSVRDKNAQSVQALKDAKALDAAVSNTKAIRVKMSLKR